RVVERSLPPNTVFLPCVGMCEQLVEPVVLAIHMIGESLCREGGVICGVELSERILGPTPVQQCSQTCTDCIADWIDYCGTAPEERKDEPAARCWDFATCT